MWVYFSLFVFVSLPPKEVEKKQANNNSTPCAVKSQWLIMSNLRCCLCIEEPLASLLLLWEADRNQANRVIAIMHSPLAPLSSTLSSLNTQPANILPMPSTENAVCGDGHAGKRQEERKEIRPWANYMPVLTHGTERTLIGWLQSTFKALYESEGRKQTSDSCFSVHFNFTRSAPIAFQANEL